MLEFSKECIKTSYYEKLRNGKLIQEICWSPTKNQASATDLTRD